MNRVRYIFLLCVISATISPQAIRQPYNTQQLNTETEKLLCLIHLFNKKVTAVDTHSLHLKEEFEKQYSLLQTLIADFVKFKNAYCINASAHPPSLQEACSYTLLTRIRALRLAPLLYQIAAINQEIAYTIARFTNLEQFTSKSTYYSSLSLPLEYRDSIEQSKDHFLSLSQRLKAAARQETIIPKNLTEEQFVKLLLTSPNQFAQFTERAALALAALHNLTITQMEYVNDLRRIITIFEKEPSSILDDTHEKRVTLKIKLGTAQDNFAQTMKAFIILMYNTIQIMDNGLSFLQAANITFRLYMPQEQEVESEVLQLLDCFAKFKL
jgi:hypothetical protein